jgi:dienelactone hydrolase
MKKLFTLLATLCLSAIVMAQTFPVGHMSINFKDASRTGGYTIPASGGTVVTMPGTGRTIGTEVYYPAAVAGNNAAVAVGQFPVVVMGHGFAMTWDAYDNIYNRLASLGYIVLMPRTESGIFPTPVHLDFGKDEALLASLAMGLNTTSTPSNVVVFNGKVLQKSAIGGHSMGAGASFLAAANNTTLTCLFNFAAATTNNTPNSIASASLVTVPTLMISGENDSVADTTIQNSHYAGIVSPIKFHTIITGLTHCEVGNGTSSTCNIGQASCGNTTCNNVFFLKYMAYLEPFLKNQLYNDCPAGNTFMTLISNPSVDRVGRKILGSIACVTTSLTNFDDQVITALFPNPATDILNVHCISKITQLQVTNIIGEEIFIENIMLLTTDGFKIDVSGFSKGVYFLNITSGNKKSTKKFIKQ